MKSARSPPLCVMWPVDLIISDLVLLSVIKMTWCMEYVFSVSLVFSVKWVWYRLGSKPCWTGRLSGRPRVTMFARRRREIEQNPLCQTGMSWKVASSKSWWVKNLDNSPVSLFTNSLFTVTNYFVTFAVFLR